MEPAHTLPRGEGTGKPGFPIPLRKGVARPHPPAGCGDGETRFPHTLLEGVALPNPPAGGGMGEPGSPMVTSGPMRGAHHARCTRPGSAGVPPASRLRGQGDDPRPSPPPRGEGVRLLPPAGGGWEGGRTLRTVFTSAVHAAAPHTDRMKKVLLGWATPSQTLPGAGAWVRGPPARVRGAWENPVSPHPSPRAYVHVSVEGNPTYGYRPRGSRPDQTLRRLRSR